MCRSTCHKKHTAALFSFSFKKMNRQEQSPETVCFVCGTNFPWRSPPRLGAQSCLNLLLSNIPHPGQSSACGNTVPLPRTLLCNSHKCSRVPVYKPGGRPECKTQLWSKAWWHVPAVPAAGLLRQKGRAFEDSLGYLVGLLFPNKPITTREKTKQN